MTGLCPQIVNLVFSSYCTSMASKRTKGSTKTSVKKAKHASSVESTECVNSQEKLLAIGLDLSDYCPLCSKNDRVCLVSSHRVSDTDSRPREGKLEIV